MQLSHKYATELKAKNAALRKKLAGPGQLLREIIDRIDVYETEGSGKTAPGAS